MTPLPVVLGLEDALGSVVYRMAAPAIVTVIGPLGLGVGSAHEQALGVGDEFVDPRLGWVRVVFRQVRSRGGT